MRSGRADAKQEKLVLYFLVDRARDPEWGYEFGSILTEIQEFAGDIASSKGLGGLVAKGITGTSARVAKATARKLVGEVVEKSIARMVERGAKTAAGRLVGGIAKAGVMATAGMPTRVTAEALKLSMPELGLTMDEAGQMAVAFKASKDDFLSALPEAMIRNFFEETFALYARVHRTIVDMAVDLCRRARRSTDLSEVALSGGVWQNQVLMDLVRKSLKRDGFTVYSHRQVPANDSGLALGQAVVANRLVGTGDLVSPRGYAPVSRDDQASGEKII